MKDKDSKITHPPSLIEMVLCEYTALLLLLFPSCSAQFPLPLPPSLFPPTHTHPHTHRVNGLYTPYIWYIYTVYILGCNS